MHLYSDIHLQFARGKPIKGTRSTVQSEKPPAAMGQSEELCITSLSIHTTVFLLKNLALDLCSSESFFSSFMNTSLPGIPRDMFPIIALAPTGEIHPSLEVCGFILESTQFLHF